MSTRIHRHPHLPRRRPRQGHRRGASTPREFNAAGPRLWQRRRLDHRQGPHRAHRRERGARASTACSTCSRTRTGRRWPTPTRPTRTMWRRSGSPFRPLYDDKIMFSGQPIALVVAEDWEIARFAASLVRVEYEAEAHATDLHAQRDEAFVRREAGRSRAATPTKAFAAADGAPRGRIFHPDRASQSDGAVRRDRGLGRRRQAHGLRQDAGRAERAALSLQRVRHEAGRCARDLAVRRRRVRLGPAPAIPGGAGGAGGAGAEALGAARADPPADVRRSATGRRRSSASRSAPRPTARSTRSSTRRSP